MPTSSGQDAAPIVLVLTTLTADTDAMTFARTLVDERLAACVNLLPEMTSVYRWKGDVSEDREQQLLIKTAPARLAALQARLHELHPYELPEFIVLDASASADYAAWVGESLQPSTTG
jgi:periplasmic divalent cation tolerance protein